MYAAICQGTNRKPGDGAGPSGRCLGGLGHCAGFSPQRGYTLIELIMVMVLIAIVGGYASTRWQGGAISARQQAERLADDIRYIQTLAMNWGAVLKLDVSSGSYQVSCVSALGAGTPCVNAGDVVKPSNNDNFAYSLQDGVTLSGTDTDFDKLGRPKDGSSLLNVSRSFTLSGGGSTWTVAVAPVTGFVSVSGP